MNPIDLTSPRPGTSRPGADTRQEKAPDGAFQASLDRLDRRAAEAETGTPREAAPGGDASRAPGDRPAGRGEGATDAPEADAADGVEAGAGPEGAADAAEIPGEAGAEGSDPDREAHDGGAAQEGDEEGTPPGPELEGADAPDAVGDGAVRADPAAGEKTGTDTEDAPDARAEPDAPPESDEPSDGPSESERALAVAAEMAGEPDDVQPADAAALPPGMAGPTDGEGGETIARPGVRSDAAGEADPQTGVGTPAGASLGTDTPLGPAGGAAGAVAAADEMADPRLPAGSPPLRREGPGDGWPRLAGAPARDIPATAMNPALWRDIPMAQAAAAQLASTAGPGSKDGEPGDAEAPMGLGAAHVLAAGPAGPARPAMEVFAAPPPAQVSDQIAEAVRRNGDGSIELALSPKELGTVRMNIHSTEAGTTIVLTAEREATMDLLRRYAGSLHETFRELGLGTLNLSFGGRDSGASGSGTYAEARLSGEAGAEVVPVTTPYRSLGALGGLDLRM